MFDMVLNMGLMCLQPLTSKFRDLILVDTFQISSMKQSGIHVFLSINSLERLLF